MRKGFTLIELSIVLVIIGLIVGGVLAGREMIRNAELRNIVSSYERFETAILAFKNKYDCLPGDCARGSQFFSGGSNGNGNSIIEATEEAQPDGNGNYNCYAGQYPTMFYAACGGTSTNTPNEGVLQWEHLSQAQLVTSESYLSASDTFTPGVHTQTLRNNSLLSLYAHNVPGTGHVIATGSTVYGYVLIMGASLAGLYPYEVHLMDAKYDDGRPVTGRIHAFYQPYTTYAPDTHHDAGGCADVTNNVYDQPLNYEMTGIGHNGCAMQIKANF